MAKNPSTRWKTTSLIALLAAAAACDAEKKPPPAAAPESKAEGPNAHIEVQHILIRFKGSPVGKAAITRTKEEARELAYTLLQVAKRGDDFDALVKKYTDDQFPGRYKMADRGLPTTQGEASRDGMVRGFGDVSFSLKVGEVGMAEYDPATSKFGWHIIKRLK